MLGARNLNFLCTLEQIHTRVFRFAGEPQEVNIQNKKLAVDVDTVTDELEHPGHSRHIAAIPVRGGKALFPENLLEVSLVHAGILLGSGLVGQALLLHFLDPQLVGTTLLVDRIEHGGAYGNHDF